MEKISKEFLENNGYSDSSTYCDTPFIYAKERQIFNQMEIVEQLASKENCPDFKEGYVKIEPMDLTDLAGYSQDKEIDITPEFLSKFSIMLDDSDEDTEDNAIILAKNSYDGVRYFSRTKTLVVPISIINYIEKYGRIKCGIKIYNYIKGDKSIKWCRQRSIDRKFRIEFLPKFAKYRIFKDEKYLFTEINKQFVSVLYKNLPIDYVMKCTVDNEFLCYDTDLREYIGHSNCNEFKLNHLCYDIAKNGLINLFNSN